MGHKTREAGIRQKQIAFLLPVIIIALTVLLVLTSNASDKVNTYQGISDVPGVYLTNGMSETEASLDKVIAMAKEEAGVCAVNYSGRTLSEYENIFTQIINTNDFVLGSGIWFEPYVYDPLQQYVGPCIRTGIRLPPHMTTATQIMTIFTGILHTGKGKRPRGHNHRPVL